MGKVYLKTKYDNEMKMEIPHNHNFASAMFGFREMAAEIVPYHLIDDIYDDFKREDIALDYIDQCNVLFNKFGVTQMCLSHFWEGKYGKIQSTVFQEMRTSGRRDIL